MVQEVLNLLPNAAARCPLGAAICGASAGLFLWLAGAKFSRSILTLAGVTAGSVIGMRLPAWRGWQIDGMGLAVGAAIVLGTFAFLFHRTCIGLLLGIGLMLWAGLFIWVLRAGAVYWNWRTVQWQGDSVQFLRDLWATLPPNLSRSLPIVCLAGLATGLTLGGFFPKVGRVLAHSLTGISLVIVMGGLAVRATRPQWLVSLPGSHVVQGCVLAALVIAGAQWQWWLTSPRRATSADGPQKS